MPQVLLLIVAGAGLWLARRLLRREQGRVADDLRAAEEAMERRELDSAVPLEQDPATGVYRPKRMH
ncbi:MAG TPA: hypothetical protein VMW57_00775 [Methyloceanibacter sp.]|nr:hypothetical protein [Methyloceanibacter sp.]